MHGVLAQITGRSSQLEVGFVATHTEPYLNLAFDIPEEQRFSQYPKNEIHKELKSAGVKLGAQQIHVVDHLTLSTTKAVDQLLKLADQRSADVIAVYTQARKGYVRLALGSFAETAIHRSRTDLLVLNPKVKSGKKIRTILLGSDFGSSTRKDILRAIAYAKQMGAKLSVIHQADPIYDWSMDESNKQVVAYRAQVHKTADWVHTEIHKAKVAGEVIIASHFVSTAKLMLNLAKKQKFDMLAVSAKSGPLAALLGGSTTRSILRESMLPVLVIKSK